MNRLRDEGRVVLAFHPERLSEAGHTVAKGLLSDGVYKNQFETGLSSGSASAFTGARRDLWERRLFGGAYHRPGVSASDRPKYGAMFLVAHPDGPCPRFGSCYFVLRPEVSARCSFTFPGSHDDLALEQSGTLGNLEPVFSPLLAHIEQGSNALGVAGLTVSGFVKGLDSGSPFMSNKPARDGLGRALDSFVEAQVHGSVRLDRDVERLVVDSSFGGGLVAADLEAISSTYEMDLDWHPGFSLSVEAVPETFRGFPTRSLADRVAGNGIVDAPTLGAGYNDFVKKPEAWHDLGSASEILVSFRRLWHVVVLFGSPVSVA